MLQRTTHANGVVTYQSPLLAAAGVVHAFSTRIGGVSTGVFTSLNLGNPGEGAQDTQANLLENYQRLQQAIGAAGMTRAWVRQVHGRAVELIEREPESEYGETLEAELRDRFSGQVAADALVSLVPDVLLTVRVADCVPILLAGAEGRTVAAVHAGWRGVVGNIVGKTVRVMQEAGVSAESLVAAIGPAISPEYFEVGPEVAEAFAQEGLAHAVRSAPPPSDGGKPHVDLPGALRRQLENAGVRRIDGTDRCTFRDAAEFFSHRRERGATGRMAAVITARSWHRGGEANPI